MKIKHSFPRAVVYLFVPIIFLQLFIGLPICNGVEAQEESKVRFWLTVLHNNDGESQLINAGAGLEDFGGIARFTTLVKKLRKEAKDRYNAQFRRQLPCRSRVQRQSPERYSLLRFDRVRQDKI